MTDVVLQTLVFASKPDTRPLYGRCTGPDGAEIELATPSRTSARITHGHRFHSDSYFNALFEGHWLRWADIRSWRLSVEVTGRGRIRVLRAEAERAPEILHDRAFDGDPERVTLDMNRSEAGRTGTRLVFEIEASESDAVLHSARWSGELDRVRPVTLIAGFCAFNHEADVLANVQRLLSEERVWRAMRRLVVVDQGEAQTLAKDIARLPGAQGRVSVLRQRNFGGSGGFTRVLLEALDDPQATHALLMDDDIEVEPESLVRTAALLSIAPETITVGGQELDLSKPTILRGSGGVLSRKDWLVRTFDRGLDAGHTATLDRLSAESRVDFNGWFYFAVGLDVVRRIGLPLPFFIVFDDVEYGLRLAGAGVRLAYVPGIAVWQQPGQLKEGRWRAYYYQRNMLVINACHQLGSRHRATGVFLRRWLRSLMRREVVRPRLACDAVRDYLRGADSLPGDPSDRNRRILQLAARAPRKCANPVGLLAACARVVTSAARLWLNARRADAEWRQAAHRLTSAAWWKRYLSLTDGAPSSGSAN